jgi:hypothetical protein
MSRFFQQVPHEIQLFFHQKRLLPASTGLPRLPRHERDDWHQKHHPHRYPLTCQGSGKCGIIGFLLWIKTQVFQHTISPSPIWDIAFFTSGQCSLLMQLRVYPVSQDSRLASGARRIDSTNFPFGLPKWEPTITLADGPANI